MNRSKHLLIASAAAALLTSASVAQQFVTYDPAVPNLELAANNCPPAPSRPRARDLHNRGAAPAPISGAVAADSRGELLYTATGSAADGIDQVPFAGIGSGALGANYPTPPGLARITGMVLYPSSTSGRLMVVTDGNVLVNYNLDLGVIMGTPIAIPTPAGEVATGLTFDSFSDELVVVTNAATILRVDQLNFIQNPSTFTWTTTAPSVPVPALATGIACSRSQPGVPMVSFYSGVVMSPETGATLPFSSPSYTTRHHRGMGFFGAAAPLGGGGSYPFKPKVRQLGSFETGQNSLEIQLESTTPALLAIDLAPTYTAIPGVPLLDGTLMVNPATCVTLVYGPGVHSLPINLMLTPTLSMPFPAVPAGTAFVAQAAGLTPGALPLSDAIAVQVWR